MNDRLKEGACPNCGASVPLKASQCPYCGTHFDLQAGGEAQPRPKYTKEQLEAVDFGYTNTRFLILALVGAALIYGYGWTLEDLAYLLSPGAVMLWGVVLPLWLAAFAFAWKSFWGQWLPGLAVGLPIFLFHLAVIFLVKGGVNDDAVGISAAFAGAALLGWVVGRALHLWVRRMRAQANT